MILRLTEAPWQWGLDRTWPIGTLSLSQRWLAAKTWPVSRTIGTRPSTAKGILFLTSDDAGYMNGAGLIVDGGPRAT